MKLITKRILAFLIDYLVIISYAAFLFIMANVLIPSIDFNNDFTYHPLKSQAIGFFSLTLPVFLFSFITEKSRWQATLGKKALHLVIETCSKNRSVHLLKRNVFKYLPWEIAHTGIHWLFYYNSKGLQIPIGVWLLLIIPQIVVIGYFVSILLNKGKQAIYDMISQTTIACRTNDVI